VCSLALFAGACDDDETTEDPIMPGDPGGGGGGGGEIDPTISIITIEDGMISPADITLPRGNTLRWVNRDETDYRITSGLPEAANAGSVFDFSIGSGEIYDRRFRGPGTFSYFGSGADMAGTITVE
jgi:plastocyanin